MHYIYSNTMVPSASAPVYSGNTSNTQLCTLYFYKGIILTNIVSIRCCIIKVHNGHKILGQRVQKEQRSMPMFSYIGVLPTHV